MINRKLPTGLMFGVLIVAILIVAGCGGKKDEQTSQEDLAAQIVPDSLPFTEKINRLTMLSFQKLDQFVQNHPEDRRDFGVAMNQLMPKDRFFPLFDGKDVTFYNLYYGVGIYSGIYPVDPSLPIDSTLSLLHLEARSQLAENLRIGTEEVSNITDDVSRGKAEGELAKLSASLEELDEAGISYYGCELQAFPGDLMKLMNNPKRVVRVIFPGNPTDGSWVRLSPYRIQLMTEQERQTGLQ